MITKALWEGLVSGNSPLRTSTNVSTPRCCSKRQLEENDFKEIIEKCKSKNNDPMVYVKSEIAVKRLAGYFGIPVSFLLVVMESLGIKPEDLLDSSKLHEITEKLAEHFGLDEEEKEELYERLKKTCDSLNSGKL
jgi:hypothetical protein